MIFRQIPQILRGQKTQTRRVVKWANEMAVLWDGPDNEYAPPDYCDEVVMVQWGKDGYRKADRSKWAIGRTYAIVPKRGSPAISFYRIRLLGIRRERLQSISEADAKAEGVESVEAYKTLWESINGKTVGARWADNPLVWVLRFELVPR